MQSGTAEKSLGSNIPLFFVVSSALTIGFTFLISYSSLKELQENWDVNRCQLNSMILASFLKPKDDRRTSTQFAIDNFAYCTRNIAKEGLMKAFAPFFAVAGQQMKGMSVFTQALNNVRNIFQNSVSSFNVLLKERYQVFVATYIQFKRVFEKLKAAYDKVTAMVVSSIYIGISMMMGMLNMYDFVIKVVIIILVILIAIVILIFLFFAPALVVIIVTVSALAGAGISVAGSGAFCLDPSTKVQMQDGSWRAISEIQLGEKLWTDSEGENIVEGVLVADGQDTDLYSIHGVLMSATHRVAYKGIWLLARNHPKAVRVSEKKPVLNTSHHKVFCKSLEKEPLPVSDWEEVTTDEGGQAWISLVNRILNGPRVGFIKTPTAPPVFGPGVRVQVSGGAWRSIESVKLGDKLFDETSVLAVYKGVLKHDEVYNSPDWISDGTWLWSDATHSWKPHETGLQSSDSGEQTSLGYSLVTESGEFRVQRLDEQILRVRDFTELGISNLEFCYDALDEHL